MKNFTPGIIPSLSKHILMEKRISTLKGGLTCLVLTWLTLTFTTSPVLANGKSTEMTKADARQIIKESSNTIRFVENKGQLPAEVKAMGTTNIGYIYLKTGELCFVSTKAGEIGEDSIDANNNIIEPPHYTEMHGWGIEFEGYNPGYRTESKNELLTKYSFFTNPDPAKCATNVSSFGEMQLTSIYNGIDLRMYSQEKNTLEYDWIVNPGADYHTIKMKFKAADGLFIDEKGDLNVKLRFDNVKLDIPEAYQIIDGRKVNVPMHFHLKGNEVTFETNKTIDNRYALIIDPSLKWGTWFDDNDSNFDEYVFAIDLDAAGNVYAAGSSNNQFTRAYTGNATVYGYSSTYADAVTGSNVSRGDLLFTNFKVMVRLF